MKLKQYKIARRLGARIFPKTENPSFTPSVAPRRGKKRPRALSEFGTQLLEKQKARYMYGISERQFSNYVKSAVSDAKANPAETLHSTLESRLDNVVYRIGWGLTRRHARQLVSHGHIIVNGRRVTVPSLLVRKGDRLSIRKQSRDKVVFQTLQTTKEEHVLPPWLSLEKDPHDGIVSSSPVSDTSKDSLFNLTSIIEFYSR
jgi:small subunit ribosomal protein S4